jgi:hypothetical protein
VASEELDIKKKSLRIVLLLAAVIAAGAALTLARTLHDEAMQGSGRQVAGAPPSAHYLMVEARMRIGADGRCPRFANIKTRPHPL